MNRWDLLFIVGTLATTLLPVICAIALSTGRWKMAQEKARARRLAEHRLNARLLRLEI